MLPVWIIPLVLGLLWTSPALASRMLGEGFAGGLPVGSSERQSSDPLDPTPTNTPSPVFTRPQIMLDSYSVKGGAVQPGTEFDLVFRLVNTGGLKARNIVVLFAAGDFLPRVNGGVLSAGVISPGASTGYTQPLTAPGGLPAGGVGSLSMQVNYTDDEGSSYSDSFTLTLSIGSPRPVASRPVSPTSTPAYRPQLLIIGYTSDTDVLKPGTRFSLEMEINNVGGTPAKRVTMILGGGASTTGDSSGEKDNGVSGGGGDFSRIAPLGSSNVQYLGDLPVGEPLKIRQSMIVNSGTEPGAYPLLVSMSYFDEKNNAYRDDQIITLLVFSPPNLEISFYRPPDPLMAGQPGVLPIQVVNIGSTSVVLGKMLVSAGDQTVENNSALVGYLDVGGYFPLDAMAVPVSPGSLTVRVEVRYFDDFNQPQVVEQELTLEVMEAMPIEEGVPGSEGMPEPLPVADESFWQKALRFLRGLLGLGSGVAEPGLSTGIEGGPMEYVP